MTRNTQSRAAGVLPACIAALTLAATGTHETHAGSIDLSGTNAEGYYAVVNINQEPNQTLSGISGDPNDPKFFDYPAFVNPENPNNVFVMAVEPYRFGLDFPDPLAPSLTTGVLQSVGTLQARNPDGTVPSGATFVEGFTEDADFNLSDIGQIDFDSSQLSGVGTEIVAPGDLTITLDTTEFSPINRTLLNAVGDVGPFGPDGRSNRNEFVLFTRGPGGSNVPLTINSIAGTGLTFVDGTLDSIDMVLDITAGSFFVPTDGTLTFAGTDFAFNVDGVGSFGFGNNVRSILNRTATIDAVGTFVIPEPGSLALAAVGMAFVARRRR
ncbi:MAG: PEP-CTERM sorting domain-containing protein [Planctomycetota bacterium]